MNLKVSTPNRTVLDVTEITSINAKGVEGEFTILPNHAPFVTQLKPGLLRYKTASNTNTLAVDTAFLEFSKNEAIILTDHAILPSEADQYRAEEAKQKAEELIQQKLEGTDFQAVEAQLRRSLLELDLVEHTRK